MFTIIAFNKVAADGGCNRDVVHRMKRGIQHGERCKVCSPIEDWG